MKPFFVLIACFGLGCLFKYFINDSADIYTVGKIALTVMLFFTAAGHFKFKKGMAMMLPLFVPAKSLIIIATGLFEILLAIAIHITVVQVASGWLLVAMFIFFLPANIYAASRHLDYEKGTYDGKGLLYLWFRIPFQLFLIGWTYYSVISSSL